MQAYQGKKEVQRMHQNDQKSLSYEIQGGQKFIQSRDERPKKKKKRPARLKTQKGGLGKSQGQRKEEEEEEEENWKILPSWKLEDAT